MKKALVLKIQGKAEVGSGRSIQATYKTMPGYGRPAIKSLHDDG